MWIHLKEPFYLFVQYNSFVVFFPIYFQVCKGASSVASNIYMLRIAALVPAAILTGFSVKATEWYWPQIWIAWTLTTTTLGLMGTVQVVDSLGKSIGCLVLHSWGIGYVMYADWALTCLTLQFQPMEVCYKQHPFWSCKMNLHSLLCGSYICLLQWVLLGSSYLQSYHICYRYEILGVLVWHASNGHS